MADIFEGLYARVIVSPLALSVILDAHSRRGNKIKHCLCALLGTLNDDGALYVKDAIPNFISGDSDAPLLPQRQHHESFVMARQRINPRELVLGWASTDISMSSLHEVAAWARGDSRASRFVPQKRLPAPIAMVVTPPSKNSDLSVSVAVRGPAPEYITKTLAIQYEACEVCEATDGSDDNTLLRRLDRVIELAEHAKQTRNEELGYTLMKLAAVSLPASTTTYLEKEREEAALFDWMSTLANLQLETSARL